MAITYAGVYEEPTYVLQACLHVRSINSLRIFFTYNFFLLHKHVITKLYERTIRVLTLHWHP